VGARFTHSLTVVVSSGYSDGAATTSTVSDAIQSPCRV
jgi:hypothetical protein